MYRPERLPCNVTLLPQLPTMILSHLENILEEEHLQIVNASASPRVARNYRVLRDFCEDHEFDVSKEHHD